VRRVLVVAKLGPPEGPAIAGQIRAWLQEQDVEVLLDGETAARLGLPGGAPRDGVPPDVDLAIAAGGDGTLLSVARAAAPVGIPVLGINLGSLGFLSELQPEELFAGLRAVLEGSYAIEERRMLRVRYTRPGGPDREYAVLNDAVIAKSALARMITIQVRVDDDEVATYTSDGLIVATPTGSTAYNLSAGGPILDPRVRGLVISPICPHTMNYRPLVVPDGVRVQVVLCSDGEEVYLTLDGQVGFPFARGDRLVVDDHPRPARLVRVRPLRFFEILRRKLRWGER